MSSSGLAFVYAGGVPDKHTLSIRKHRLRGVATGTGQNWLRTGRGSKERSGERPASGRGIVTRLTFGVNT